MGIEIFIQHFGGLLAEIPSLAPTDRDLSLQHSHAGVHLMLVTSLMLLISWQSVCVHVHVQARGRHLCPLSLSTWFL